MNDDIIIWRKGYLLTWNDFQGPPNPKGPYPAASAVGHGSGNTKVGCIKTKSRTKFLFEIIELEAEFNRTKSWVRERDSLSKEAGESLLKHEQGHFDHAEELRPKFLTQIKKNLEGKRFSVKGKTKEQIEHFVAEESAKILNENMEKINREWKTLERKYDTETNHGLNKEKQQEYNKRFDRLQRN